MEKPEKDSLGDRMKTYECVPRVALTRRLPTIIRVDGKSFHSLTHKMEKPWDPNFVRWMQHTAAVLCAEIDGCVLAYVQSDEISLLVRDDMTLHTEAWFGKDLQKIVSVSAALATCAFVRISGLYAAFDGRAFVLPPTEVCNYFVWRQQDAVRNSISMLAQTHFSQKQLHGVKSAGMQEMLFQERGINWNDTPTHLKRGSCVVKESYRAPLAVSVGDELSFVERTRWTIDLEIPTFTQDRDYVERLLVVDGEG